jgi:hypothetical protein
MIWSSVMDVIWIKMESYASLDSMKILKNPIMFVFIVGGLHECQLQMRLWKLLGTAEHPFRRSQDSRIVVRQLQKVLVTVV